MRLGVEAAIVEGELLPGDIEVADGRIVSRRPRAQAGRRHRRRPDSSTCR